MAYWGEPGKMKFKSSIESFSDASQIDGEKLIQTTFSVNLYGYILPETFDGKTTTQKYLTPKKLIIRESTEKTLVDDEGKKVDLSSNASEFGEQTKDIFTISLENSFDIKPRNRCNNIKYWCWIQWLNSIITKHSYWSSSRNNIKCNI